MKLVLTLLAVILAHSSAAFARPTVTVTQFEDKITYGPCSLNKALNKDLKDTLAKKVIGIFANHPDLHVMNLEHSGKPLRSQYLVTGTVRSFDQCPAIGTKKARTTRVAMDMRIIETSTGRVAFSFTSTANAVGNSSNLGQTANVVLYDLTGRVERALTSHKMVHIVDRKKARKLASRDLTVKIIRRDPDSR